MIMRIITIKFKGLLVFVHLLKSAPLKSACLNVTFTSQNENGKFTLHYYLMSRR